MNAVLLTMAVLGQVYQKPLVDIGRDIFALSDKAYLLMPPVPVAPDVQEIRWSPQGKTLLFRSTESGPEAASALSQLEGQPPSLTFPESRIGLYSPQTGKTRWASGFPPNAIPMGVQWSSETTAIVEVMRVDLVDGAPTNQRHELFFLVVGSGRLTSLGASQVQTGEYVDVIAEPTVGMAMVMVRKRMSGDVPPEQGVMYEISGSGQVIPAPASVQQALAQGWHPGQTVPGKGILFMQYQGGQMFFRLLTPKMVFEPWSESELKNQAEPPASLTRAPGLLGDMLLLSPTVREAEDQAGSQPVVICQQVEQGELSPTLGSVAYTSQRMLWIRPIQPISLDAYLKALEAKRRLNAMSNAKQVGTALMIFAADNDDNLPTGDPVAALEPYLRNRDILKDFVFTLPPNRSLVDIENPASTEIGYIPLPGGRVVTYADSHVKWIPDKQP